MVATVSNHHPSFVVDAAKPEQREETPMAMDRKRRNSGVFKSDETGIGDAGETKGRRVQHNQPRARHWPQVVDTMKTTATTRRWGWKRTKVKTNKGRRWEQNRDGDMSRRRSFFQDLFRNDGDTNQGTEDVLQLESEEEFDEIVANAGNKPVVLSASMTYCGPCKIAKPKYRLMAEYYRKEAIFVAVEGDTNPSTEKLLSRLGITAVPAYRVFLKGENVSTDLMMPMGSVDANIKVLRSALLTALKQSKS